MSPWLTALLAAAAYIVGSIPFSVFLVRWSTGRDVRAVGSGNPGATNALRIAGPRIGLLTLSCDVLKGVVPVVLAHQLEVSDRTLGWVAAAVVLGHVYSVFLGFRGGKGVATAAGALGSLAPAVLLAVVPMFVLVLASSRFVSLASVAASLSFPMWWFLFGFLGWLRPPSVELLLCATLVALLIAYKHRSNFARIRRGAERRLGELRVREGEGLDDAMPAHNSELFGQQGATRATGLTQQRGNRE